MTTTKGLTLADAIEQASHGRKISLVCPAHEDDNPSLSVGPGTTQPITLYCHAGCDTIDILAAEGLDWADVSSELEKREVENLWVPGDLKASNIYRYYNAQGTLAYEVLRAYDPAGKKRFFQRQPDPDAKSGYQWNLDGVERMLYRLPEVLEAVQGGSTIHVCFSPDTEVLTPEGWVMLPDLPQDSMVAQYGLNGEVQFVLPTERQILPFEGEMVHLKSNFSDTLVTPDHRMLRKSRLDLDATTISAEQVRAQSYLPVSGVNRDGTAQVTEDDARLVAAWQADGSNLPSRLTCGWNAKKSRKIERIATLLDAVGVPWKRQEFESAPGWVWTKAERSHWSLTSEWKSLSWAMLDWPLVARQAFINELPHWDGDSTGQQGIRFFTADPQAAEIVSAVAVTSGFGVITRVDVRADRPDQQPQYVLNITPKGWRRIAAEPERVPYKGLVFCLTVPSSYLVTRRNGKTAIAGNCEGEKCVERLQRVLTDGDVATTNSGGAGKFTFEMADVLSGASVVVYADSNDVGREHARNVREMLVERGCVVQILEAPPGTMPNGKTIGDVADHLESDRRLDSMLETTPGSTAEKARSAVDLLDLVTRPEHEFKFVIPGVLARSERLLLVGLEGHGKDVCIDTSLVTPTGWTTMGEVRVGEQLIGSDGNPCRVVAKSEVFTRTPDDGYVVTFSDGSEIIAGATHQWVTYTERERGQRKVPQVRTTEDIRATIESRPGFTNHSVKVADAVELPEADLPIHPYTFGAWLGDGASDDSIIHLSVRDGAISGGVEDEGYEFSQYPERNSCAAIRVKGMKSALRDAGVLDDKHIPATYLRGSLKQRMALLAGICDTDGYCPDTGKRAGRGAGSSIVEVVFTNRQLAMDLYELILTLGIQPRMIVGDAKIDGRFISKKYRVNFQSPFNPFRHAAFKADRWRPLRTQRSQHRYIKSVEPILIPRQTQCVEVDSSDHTFLCGDAMIPTHNSHLMRQFAVSVAMGVHPFTGLEMEPKRVLYIDAENHPGQVLGAWKRMKWLVEQNKGHAERGMLNVLEEWDSEIDLTTVKGRTWLKERVHAYRPDLLLLGPLKNLVQKNLADHDTVNALRYTINSARTISECAVILEHHAPLRSGGDKERELRPYGSGLFLGWPDFGYAMKPTSEDKLYEWQQFRGDRVRDRQWPMALRWGKGVELPWCPDLLPEDR